MSYNPYSIIVLQFVSFDKTNTNITIKIKIHSKWCNFFYNSAMSTILHIPRNAFLSLFHTYII